MTDNSQALPSDLAPAAPVAGVAESGSGRGTELPPVPRPTIAQLCGAIDWCVRETSTCSVAATQGMNVEQMVLASDAAAVLREAMYLLREYRSRPHHPSLEVAGYHQLGMIEDDTVQRAFNLLREVRP